LGGEPWDECRGSCRKRQKLSRTGPSSHPRATFIWLCLHPYGDNDAVVQLSALRARCLLCVAPGKRSRRDSRARGRVVECSLVHAAKGVALDRHAHSHRSSADTTAYVDGAESYVVDPAVAPGL